MAAWLKLWYPKGTIRADARSTSEIISPWEAAVRFLARVRHDTELRRSRRALLDLTDDQLRDVGLTREDAKREGRRSLYLD